MQAVPVVELRRALVAGYHLLGLCITPTLAPTALLRPMLKMEPEALRLVHPPMEHWLHPVECQLECQLQCGPVLTSPHLFMQHWTINVPRGAPRSSEGA